MEGGGKTKESTMMQVDEESDQPESEDNLSRNQFNSSEVDQAVSHLIASMQQETNERDQSNVGMEGNSSAAGDTWWAPVEMDWESSIIWDASKESASKIKAMAEKRAGWVPTGENLRGESCSTDPSVPFHSILPFDNKELVDGNWEEDIIWDAEKFTSKPQQPKVPTYCIEDILHRYPVDWADPQNEGRRGVLEFLFDFNKTNGLINTEGCSSSHDVLNLKDMFYGPDDPAKRSPTGPDFYNISNDQYYQPVDAKNKEMVRHADLTDRHSKIVKQLLPPFVKLGLTPEFCRVFHRPPLTVSCISKDIYRKNGKGIYFTNLAKRIKKKAKEYKKLLRSGTWISLDNSIQLSGRDGHLVLMENCEEYPPLLSQVGMASKFVNYYCQNGVTNNKSNHDNGRQQDIPEPVPPMPYGETKVVKSLPSPYLGSLPDGEMFSTLENNMYCAPVYPHKLPETDFLLIVNRNLAMIRGDISNIFAVGQQFPLINVPSPACKEFHVARRKILQAFLSKNFSENPKRELEWEEFRNAFLSVTEKNLKAALPTDIELIMDNKKCPIKIVKIPNNSGCSLVESFTPEMYCSFLSSISAQQRLVDAVGFLDTQFLRLGRKVANAEKGGSLENREKLLDELDCAPWNTTSVFTEATCSPKPNRFLGVYGNAEPTGCGLGFSYTWAPKTAYRQMAIQKMNTENMVLPGTDIPLKSLRVPAIKPHLRRYGIQEVNSLRGGQARDLITTIAAKNLKSGKENQSRIDSLYAEWKKTQFRTMTEKIYKEECQIIFELQNSNLASVEDSTTEEDDSDDDEEDKVTRQSDIEEMCKTIHGILNGDIKNKSDSTKSLKQIQFEQEERERIDLKKLMIGKPQTDPVAGTSTNSNNTASNVGKMDEKAMLKYFLENPGKALKLTRTFIENGEKVTETETIRDLAVITAYIQMKNTRDVTYIRKFIDKFDREQKLKEKIQRTNIKEIVRMRKAKEEKQEADRKRINNKKIVELESDYFPNLVERKRAERKIMAVKGAKCGNCGLRGHAKDSKDCLLYNDKAKQMAKPKTQKQSKKKQEPPTENLGMKPGDFSLLNYDLKLSESSSESDDDSSSDSSSGDSSSSVGSNADQDKKNKGKSTAHQTKIPPSLPG